MNPKKDREKNKVSSVSLTKLGTEVAKLKTTLDEVWPMTLDEWIVSIRSNSDPMAEFAIWQRMAKAYKACTYGKAVSPERKKEFFMFILISSTCPRECVCMLYEPEHLSHDEAMEAVAAFYAAGEDDSENIRKRGVNMNLGKPNRKEGNV